MLLRSAVRIPTIRRTDKVGWLPANQPYPSRGEDSGGDTLRHKLQYTQKDDETIHLFSFHFGKTNTAIYLSDRKCKPASVLYVYVIQVFVMTGTFCVCDLLSNRARAS